MLLAGTLVSWAPVIGLIGLLAGLIGFFAVLSGRKVFGPIHRRNVLISVVLFVMGVVGLVVGTVVVLLVALGSIPSGSGQPQVAAVLQNALTNLLILTVAAAVVTNFSLVVLVHDLQNRNGRLLLWAAYGASLGLQTAVVALALPLIPGLAAEVARQIATTGVVDSSAISTTISGEASGLAFFGAIPAALFAAADYLALARIKKGEIPPAETPPSGPIAPPSLGVPVSPPQPP